MADTITNESRVVELACDVIDCINTYTYTGPISLKQGLTDETSTALCTTAYFELDTEIEINVPGNFLNNLKVFVGPLSEAYGFTNRNRTEGCATYQDDLIVCIARKFEKGNLQDMNNLFFFKEELVTALMKHLLVTEEFLGFGDSRVTSIDRTQAAKKRFVTYIPLSYECSQKLRCPQQQVSSEIN